MPAITVAALRESLAEENAKPKYKSLIGKEDATLDDKGRILISKKKRDRLGENFVLILGTVGCITIYPEHVWDRLTESLDECDAMDHGMEQYTRLVFATAHDDLRFDAQGRLVVPQELRKLAGLKKHVLVIGAHNRIELWDPQEYESYNEDPQLYGLARRDALERAYAQMKAGKSA